VVEFSATGVPSEVNLITKYWFSRRLWLTRDVASHQISGGISERTLVMGVLLVCLTSIMNMASCTEILLGIGESFDRRVVSRISSSQPMLIWSEIRLDLYSSLGAPILTEE